MSDYFIMADGKSPHTYKWVKELSKHFTVYIVSFNGFSDAVLTCVTANRCYDLTVDINTGGGNFKVLKSIRSVANILKLVNPDYLNAHYITSYGTVGVLAAKISGYKGKIIMSAWGSDILVTPWKNKMYFYLTKWLLNNSDMVTSDSDYMSKRIWDICASSHIMTFPFGVENVPEMSFCEKDYNWYFSNRALEHNYNVDKIIRFFSLIYKNNNAARLIIANDGSECTNLKYMVQEMGLNAVVNFVGFLSAEEQIYYYKKCGFYLSVPSSDSTSVSLLEAMAYGCFPIVSDLPANREWVTDCINGVIGLNFYTGSASHKTIFTKNRSIIANKAIWKKNIERYIQRLTAGE